jgi:O-antigen ligase
MYFTEKNIQAIYFSAVVVLIPIISLSLFLYTPLPILAFVGVIFAFALLVFPSAAFPILLLSLPLSIEYYVGSFGTDLPSEPIAILVSVLSIFFVLTKRIELKALVNHKFTVVLFLLYMWAVSSTFFSTNPILSLKYLLAKGWYILGFYFAAYIFSKNKKDIALSLTMLFIPTIIGVVYVFIRHGIMGFTFDSINEACQPIFRNHVNYAIFLGMIFPYVLYKISVSEHSSIFRILYTFFALFLLICIYFTYTRGVWLALLALPFFIYIIHSGKVLTIYLSILLVILGLGIYLAKDSKYLAYAPNYDTTIYHSNLDDHLKATLAGEDMSTMERFHRWIAAIKSVPQYGLFGSGPNTFNAVYKRYTVSSFQTYISKNEERSTVHNYALLMLTEQGIIGALLYLIWIGYIFYYMQRYYHNSSGKNRKLLLAIACSQFIFLINNCFSDLIESNKVGSLFYINLAWLIVWRQQIKGETTTKENIA